MPIADWENSKIRNPNSAICIRLTFHHLFAIVSGGLISGVSSARLQVYQETRPQGAAYE